MAPWNGPNNSTILDAVPSTHADCRGAAMNCISTDFGDDSSNHFSQNHQGLCIFSGILTDNENSWSLKNTHISSEAESRLVAVWRDLQEL